MTNLKNKKTLISQIILAIVLLILLFLVLFPFWLMLVKSFKSFMQEVESPLTLTFPLAWENYRVAWEQIGGSILNSFFVSGMEALITLFLSAVGAYGFSRYRFRFKNLLYSCFLALMMIPGVLTLTTKYVMVATTFGMYGSFLGVIYRRRRGWCLSASSCCGDFSTACRKISSTRRIWTGQTPCGSSSACACRSARPS